MTPDDLLVVLSRALGVTLAQLRSRVRTRHIAQARQAAAWSLHQTFPKLSQQSIGHLLGGLDHTTVKYAIDRVAARLADDPALFLALNTALPALFKAPPSRHTIPPGMAFWAALGRKAFAVVSA